MSTLALIWRSAARKPAAGVGRSRGGPGVPGRILPREGRVVFSPNVPALNECPLVSGFPPRSLSPVPENDANLFALGEHCWGPEWAMSICWGLPWEPGWEAG